MAKTSSPNPTKKATKKKAAKPKATSATPEPNSPSPTKKRPTKKKASAPKDSPPAEPSTKIVYPEPKAMIYRKDGKNGSLTLEMAKALIGWTEETENVKFGPKFHIRGRGPNSKSPADGPKVRLLKNLTNRPFYPPVALEWMYNILKRRWKLNGEAMIFDRLGNAQDAQHRLVGFIWACQEWEHRSMLYREHWKDTPYLESVVVVGISEDDDTVNTINTGKPRTFTDVIYRSEIFRDVSDKSRKQIAGVIAWAVKYTMLRVHATVHGFSMGRSHGDAMDFVYKHKRLLEAARFVFEENDGNRLSKYAPLGMAAALLYLAGCSEHDPDPNDDNKAYDPGDNSWTDERLDWSLWDKAEAFWAAVPENEALAPLRNALEQLEAGGSLRRDEVFGMTIQAFLAWADDQPISAKTIELEKHRDEETGDISIVDHPLIGGIDLGPTVTEEEIVEE